MIMWHRQSRAARGLPGVVWPCRIRKSATFPDASVNTCSESGAALCIQVAAPHINRVYWCLNDRTRFCSTMTAGAGVKPARLSVDPSDSRAVIQTDEVIDRY